MTSDNLKRKLAAILSADVKGYSKLMGEDEEWTLRTLNTYKGLIRNLVGEHRGRIVGGAGDSILAEFASVVDAVECAVEIQQVLKAKNAILPETRKMDFRIGINLGDVIEEEDSIYGDGVNIAARLEGLADPGGICVSGTAYDQIENKIPLHYDFLGEHEVKNIAKPVRVYRARIEPETVPSPVAEEKRPARKGLSRAVLIGIALVVIAASAVLYQFAFRPAAPKTEVASKEKMAFPLPDVPSIAVLPFVNMSGDPKQEFLSDGISEEIITALSKLRSLFVISRQSTFSYKGKPVKVKQISEELGVRYVLEGSLQRSDDRIRINAQLIDALTGRHIWAEQYERDLRDLFALQDDITMKILSAIRVKLTEGEAARLSTKGTKNLEAYLKVMQASQLRDAITKENMARCRKLAEEAIALDPGYAMAYSSAAGALAVEIYLGVYKNPKEALERAMKLAIKGVTLDESSAYTHSVLSWLMIMSRDFEKGVAEAERAVTLEPGSGYAYTVLGLNLNYAGRYKEAIPVLKNAIRLMPIPSALCLNSLGFSYRMLGRYEESIASLKKLLQREPDSITGHLHLAATYVMAGKEAEAHAETAEILRINPQFSLEQFAKTIPMKNQTDLTDRWIEPLRKAGLK